MWDEAEDPDMWRRREKDWRFNQLCFSVNRLALVPVVAYVSSETLNGSNITGSKPTAHPTRNL